jgi:hypothetical protein
MYVDVDVYDHVCVNMCNPVWEYIDVDVNMWVDEYVHDYVSEYADECAY